MKRLFTLMTILLLSISICYDEREILLMNDNIPSINELNLSFIFKGILRKINCKYEYIEEEMFQHQELELSGSYEDDKMKVNIKKFIDKGNTFSQVAEELSKRYSIFIKNAIKICNERSLITKVMEKVSNELIFREFTEKAKKNLIHEISYYVGKQVVRLVLMN